MDTPNLVADRRHKSATNEGLEKDLALRRQDCHCGDGHVCRGCAPKAV